MNEKKSLILMVEDEEQVLNTNCRMLRRRGYDVRIAQTAAEACHQLEEYLPDLLILTLCFRTETVWISAAASAKNHAPGSFSHRKK